VDSRAGLFKEFEQGYEVHALGNAVESWETIMVRPAGKLTEAENQALA
jgi:hypothetical protein